MDLLAGFCLGVAVTCGVIGTIQAHRLQRDIRAHIRALDAAERARLDVERELGGNDPL
jgi:hypothetical protein